MSESISDSLVLSKIDHSMATIDMVLQMAIRSISEFIQADRCTLFLYDEARRELWSRVSDGTTKDGLKEIRVKLGEGIAGSVMKTGETLNITDAYSDGRFYRKIDEVSGYVTKSIYAQPLVNTQAKRIGVIQIVNKRGGALTETDKRLLDAFCMQVVVAIENAQLYQHVKQRRDYEHQLHAQLEEQHRQLEEAYRELEDRNKSLQSVMAKLEDANRTLEMKVKKRTQRLKEKNDALEQALEKLTRTQDQLIMQEKFATLGVLTAGIAHEIKNPLNFINNFALLSVDLADELNGEWSKYSDHLTEEVKATFRQLLIHLKLNSEKISTHGRRADNIVRAMLAHAHGKRDEKELTDINELVDEYAKLAYHGRRAEDPSFQVNISTKCDPKMERVRVFPQELGRVILNIVNNACYATTRKKEEVGGDYRPEIILSTLDRGQSVEIRIRDNGMGIPKEVQAKVMQPFFSTKPTGSGTGLGLSISNEIITQAHKGKLSFETKPGEFTEWIISLPKDQE